MYEGKIGEYGWGKADKDRRELEISSSISTGRLGTKSKRTGDCITATKNYISGNTTSNSSHSFSR
jgi:hypothetical protein